MGWKKLLGDIKEKSEKFVEEKKKERNLRRIEQQEQAEQRAEYENTVNKLLDKFEIPDLDEFLMKYLNNKPEPKIEKDPDIGKITKIRPGRREYLDFVWSNFNEKDITYDQLKNFALKKKIITPSFFGNESDDTYEKSDFESIINAIRVGFEPEKITDEEHLEAQLMIFLKAKFPDRKIRRQVTIQGNDRLDILIDDKYAFELKVPKQRTDLRNLGAQLEEYKEMYPNVCGLIFEDINEGNLSQDIMDYVDKYKKNYGISTIVLGGTKRYS
ncbi:MAG: hypothetical protein KGZ34_00380 [Nitrosarchaeum sp.]|nr:hypothetical protein [Nitrosarchaeum sp.]